MSANYHATFSFQADLAGLTVEVVSKPGLAAAHLLLEASNLAANLIRPAATERVLLLGAGHGALGVGLARHLTRGHLVLIESDLIALRMTQLTFAANQISGGELRGANNALPGVTEAFDRVILFSPKSRALGRRWLLEAQAYLRREGILNIVGAQASGVRSLIADAQALTGKMHILGYGKGCRVAETRCIQPLAAPPAWTTLPGIRPGSWIPLTVDLPGGASELVSLPGVFSAEHLDPGTAFLLSQLGQRCHGKRVLDVGCGYGVIGLAAAQLGAKQVDLADVNLLALAAARENVERLGLSRVIQVHPSDGLEAVLGQRYDLVLSNPPFHTGKTIDTAMAEAFLREARSVLVPGGTLLIVANRFLPYERVMQAHFGTVTVVATCEGYRVLAGS
ncbi:methyltransferase [Candidatus Chloroploca sp. Khr17]|uniref:methyltransferase n=1 Tax=Candidatus Chloroploca sp. Khr17 TaxID=2496869 RepID=UPI0013EA8D8A|nr:methyltransferase [Candidatus Chloroploca sp. Khr17]